MKKKVIRFVFCSISLVGSSSALNKPLSDDIIGAYFGNRAVLAEREAFAE